MKRRRFLSLLGIGAALPVTGLLAAVSTGDPGRCSCAGQSFWDGPCDWCREHYGPQGYRGATVESYADYTNFSQFSIENSIDSMVTRAAEELGRAHGLRIANLVRVG